MATTKATVGVIKDGSITAAKLAANSVDSDSYVNGSIDPEHLADNAVTLAKMASGTDGNIISFDSSGNPVAIATGNDGQVLTSAGANAQPAFEDAAGGGFTLGTEVATGSGTSATFSNIPAGTTVVHLMFENFKTSATEWIIEIGDAGGIETSGYSGGSIRVDGGTSTGDSAASQWRVKDKGEGASAGLHGVVILSLKDAANFTWVQSYSLRIDKDVSSFGAGSKSLSAELTQLKVSGGTFSSGSINVSYS